MEYKQSDKNSIKSLFNQVAKNYDRMNNFMSFGLQKRIKLLSVKNVIKKINTDDNVKILDLCTGTGDIAILFKKVLENCEVTGVDFSKEMLSVAEKRTADITFIDGDITNLESLPIEKNCFDICFIGFGLRNLPDIDEFLENIKEYLKPNGILSILDLGKPAWFMKPYFYLHYEVFIPLLALIFNREAKPYKYFINSSKTYPSQKEMMQKLKSHGYKNISNNNFSFGIISQQTAEKL